MSTSPSIEPNGHGIEARSRMSRDRTSSVSGATPLAAPPSVSPEPSYIAASAASQIITSDRQAQSEDWFEENGDKAEFEGEGVVVSSASLALINAFLDQLLFNFLGTARSTSIAALRPAVSEVLKPRLAKEAINGADQELDEFLGGGDEEELSAFHNGLEPRGPWDLHIVWRRTRLRCMVYTRLGEMEEEDEEAFVARERAEADDEGLRRLSRDLGIVSPAAAIFLTSILEFIGEQVLVLAGEAAYSRLESKRLKDQGRDIVSPSELPRVVVEDSDMEKLAFNTTFGRLWRSWKKRVRTPSMLSTRTISRDLGRGKGSLSPTSNPTSRKASISEMDPANPQVNAVLTPSVAQILEKPTAPVEDTSSERSTMAEGEPYLVTEAKKMLSSPRQLISRPHSMAIYSQLTPRPESRRLSESTSPLSRTQHRRSSSLPSFQSAPNLASPEVTNFTPTSLQDEFKSREEEETIVSRRSASGTSSSSATSTSTRDDAPTPDDIPDGGTETVQQPHGMSKEEFDKQLLALVRDSESHAADTDAEIETANTHDISLNHELSDSALGSRTSQGSVHSEPLEAQDTHQNTMDYWRGARDESSKDRSLSSQDNQDSQAKRTQGERPRTASSGTTPDHEYGRVWEHQAPYFYGVPATAHNFQAVKVPPSQGQNSQSSYSTSGQGSQANNDENGAPPLTPLRELMEAAYDTSDEASSLAPSHEASKSASLPQYHSSYGGYSRVEPFPSQALSQAKPASKFSDLRSKLPAVNTGTERAGVQRVLPSPPVSAREPLTPVPRTSSSSNRDLKLIPTSSSATSQVSQKLKGLVGRDSNDGRRPTTSRRSSEGSVSVASDKRSLRTPKADEAQRSFDQLIKSDETLQYTLTPQTVRDMEIPDSPRWNSHKRTGTADMADLRRNPAPDQPPRPSTSRSIKSLKGINGLAANPIKIGKPIEPARVTPNAPTSALSQSKTPSRPTTSHTNSGVAREARANSESTRDFADFLRSTGPSEDADAQVQAQKATPVAAPKPINALPAVSRPTSGHGAKKITKQNPSSLGQPMQSSSPKSAPMARDIAGPALTKNRTTRLQARDPTVPGGTSSDLIDFIRQGPTEQNEGRLRLPRTGDPPRPFGDTNSLTKGRTSEGDRSRLSVASTQISSVPSKSVQSINSRTGLLESGDHTREARHRASGSIESQPGRHAGPPQPKRRQYRNKDPYAVDTDSDDDEHPHSAPPKAEESLIEFLNSVAPTPPTARNTLANGSSLNSSSTSTKIKYPTMRDRLDRNGVSGSKSKAVAKESLMGVPSITRGKSEAKQTGVGLTQGKTATLQHSPYIPPSNRGRVESRITGDGVRSQAPQLPPLNPRETSPHLISKVGNKFDTYRITEPTYAAHIDRERNGGARRTPVHHQARGNREPDLGLSDLADFLKNSEPPMAQARVETPPAKEKEKEGGFGRMFSRRKKVSQT